MKNNKKVFILGANSDIGLSIMKIYQKYNYKVLAHYNNGNKNCSNSSNEKQEGDRMTIN